MLVKIFSNRGGGGAKASIDYLMDKEQGKVSVLKGNPRLSQKIAENLKFATPYTVGCLSFEEKNISAIAKREIIDKFENTVFAGLSKEQYNIAWIEHTDKGRLELNFFIPNVELTTGKRLQPYYDKADRALIENFKQVINHEYGLSDPNHPSKKQLLIHRKDLPKAKNEALEAISNGISSLVQVGAIKDRGGVLRALEGAGFEIARVTNKNISIKTDGQNLRLKGEFYEKSFRISENIPRDISERAREYERTSEERYQIARGKLDRATSERERNFGAKYQSRAREIDNAYQENVKNAVDNHIHANRDKPDNPSLSNDKSPIDLSRNERMEAVSGTMASLEPRDYNQTMQDKRGIEALYSDRSELQRTGLGGQYEDNRNQTADTGEIINGDRSGNSFREHLESIVRTAIDRASGIIEKIREIGERILGDNRREQLDPQTVQGNTDRIDELKQLTKDVKDIVREKQIISSINREKNLTL